MAATRRDTELVILRLTSTTSFGPRATLQAEVELQGISPPFSSVSRLAAAGSRSFLPLQESIADSEDLDLLGRFDRLALELDLGGSRLVLGRQAITWGVTYFWPSMDLFAPFGPERIDRDYKPGVDAARLIVPLGPYSEVELIGGVMGSSASKDWSTGALARIHLGRLDLGVMGGRFHGDTVAGWFATTDIGGTGVRGELTWTRSDEEQDALRDRREFVRGSFGIDRQLDPRLVLTVELSYNGYGESDPSDYPLLLSADRVLRGEVYALGKLHAGVSCRWELHPLWNMNQTVLLNGGDGSALWIPSLTWSTGNDSELILGGQLGLGEGLEGSVPGSEYGAVPHTVFVGFKRYF